MLNLVFFAILAMGSLGVRAGAPSINGAFLFCVIPQFVSADSPADTYANIHSLAGCQVSRSFLAVILLIPYRNNSA
jgi:hypothetical protein